MCKKLITVGLVVLVALFVLRKTELGSLVRVWWHDGQACLESSISPETRIIRCVRRSHGLIHD